MGVSAEILINARKQGLRIVRFLVRVVMMLVWRLLRVMRLGMGLVW